MARAQTLYTMASEQLDKPVMIAFDQDELQKSFVVDVWELDRFGGTKVTPYYFYVSPNLVLQSLRVHIENSLYKINNGYNSAGMRKQAIGVSDYARLVDRHPTPYRFGTLIDRAKQLVQVASQVESSMLSALEKKDAADYDLLKARKDIQLTQAQIQVQNLKLKEVQNSEHLADLQKDRAQLQYEYYDDLITNGQSDYEFEQIKNILDILSRYSDIYQTLPYTPASDITYYSAEAAISGVLANLDSIYASQQRREQDWEHQRGLAQQDVAISEQQQANAVDEELVVQQEQAISVMQAENAQAVVDFLVNKFTNVELYDWMSTVLEKIYLFFLQQATAIARLAEDELMFERPDALLPTIATDYWNVALTTGSSSQNNGDTKDRRGLTGLSACCGISPSSNNTPLRRINVSCKSRELSLWRLSIPTNSNAFLRPVF